MSLLIQNYYNEVDRLVQYGGSRKETSIRSAFQKLLDGYAKKHSLMIVAELDYKTANGKTVYPDGTLKGEMRLAYGYWESKDEADDLDKEIRAKFDKGYPNDNILFEDSKTAVLFQAGKEVYRVNVRDEPHLDTILLAFTGYEPPQVKSFREAITRVKTELPIVSQTLRDLIHTVTAENFVKARLRFYDLCKQVINPEITLDDINEMLIQHILTEDIFNTIYDEAQYHQENNIALELKNLEVTFFKGDVRRNMLDKIRPYYKFIEEHGKSITSHKEKKAFLNAVYEDFYKAYNPKMADKLGVVYTPFEIVNFMIDSTNFLLDKHFNLTLSDKNVEILDPATGTGTFVCALIEKIDKRTLAYKYEHEIFANEVSILPYYIANLNIEYTFRQRMETNKEFTNLCFVDTLDNITALKYAGKQTDFFGFSAENAVRIKRQNKAKISVIIGNPPYNAKQENFNDQNANRKYPAIDKRIKETYIKEGSAQNQIVVYDAYTRFYRWATDRLDKNGILAYITNRSFIDSRAFDGFRKTVAKEFNEIYIIDTRSDVRANPKIAGTTHNVFGIQTGVAVLFLVKNAKKTNEHGAKIFYTALPDEMLKQDKLNWFNEYTMETIDFERILPDDKGNWINLTDNDFDTLVPVCSKEVKAGKGSSEAIFELFSSGVKTQRDEWAYDFDKDTLESKIKFFADVYTKTMKDKNYQDKFSIKWDAELESYLNRGIEKEFDKMQIVKSIYRPYVAQWLYFDKHFNGRTYQWYNIYQDETKDKAICMSGLGSSKDFQVLATKYIGGLDFLEKTQCLPLYRYDNVGKRVDNITDWALDLFRKNFPKVSNFREVAGSKNSKVSNFREVAGKTKEIEKEDIFHYVYAVLHNPAYRQKYEQNLKRDFPRIPLYADFWAWATAGKELMTLHLAYETATPYALTVHLSLNIEHLLLNNEQSAGKNKTPKVKLKAVKETGEIIIDEHTTLRGVPAEAWEYKLGNRSALEWILDQYKEGTPSDATIAERFHTYRFADYKEQVIDLLARVCTVSVETVRIISHL